MCKPNIALHELWMYFWRNHADFNEPGSEALIAKNEATNVLLTMGKNGSYPELRVYLNEDIPHVIRSVYNKEECTTTAARLYNTWLSDDEAEDVKDETVKSKKEEPAEQEEQPEEPEEEEEPDLTPEEAIYQRETQLSDAMGQFLAEVLGEHDGPAVEEAYGAEMIDQCVDDLLQLLYEKHNINVWRPVFVENPDNGEVEYVEFPYGD